MVAALTCVSPSMAEDSSEEASSAKHARGEEPWSARNPAVLADLAAGRPLVVQVVVPLCSNAQIDCGASWAGQPGRTKTNLYWGAIYGARRFLERKNSGFERVSLSRPEQGIVLEQAVYRRPLDGNKWHLPKGRDGELIVILQAVHGANIDDAVYRFWDLATQQKRVSFDYRGKQRTERLHVAGYAGHNRLMDGLHLPDTPVSSSGARSAFVLACYSESYFGAALNEAGVQSLVTTRALMAPEGYLLLAILQGLADNAATLEVRRRAVAAYARWQRLSPTVARRIFQP